jgi:hypothetical protein
MVRVRASENLFMFKMRPKSDSGRPCPLSLICPALQLVDSLELLILMLRAAKVQVMAVKFL